MTGWFPGEGRNPDDEAFLAELRRLAATSGLADATPADTRVYAWDALVVLVAIPKLQDLTARPMLEVVSRGSQLMVGVETYDHLVDA
jgi:hypothetical protein